ncbi:MAG: phosphoribosyl-ATP diphosphatase [Gemmatimonadota bacterium]|jgi:phosphoribosyl-ATP pyrophosphohydrolase
MIIPSIDLMDGRAVQLRRGRERVLDGGDPLQRLKEFSVAGEVAVVDLDAALGKGSNAGLIREMVRIVPCRVGGGIRDLDTALDWLDAGAAKIMIGTAASVEFCSRLPKDRVMAAVDVERGSVVVEGWRKGTGLKAPERIRELAPVVGGFLFTQVEHEGGLAGFDLERVREAVAAAGDTRVTAAGGITAAIDVGELDRLGADAQVGMALYTGRMTLGAAISAPLSKPVERRFWPTVVCDEAGSTLGLVWSTRESVEAAVEQRRGIYWSRSRDALWVKGETSGSTQELLRVDLDCDRDALRFTVRQHGSGFCHTGDPACWPSSFSISSLEKVIRIRAGLGKESPSGTARLLADPKLLRAKLLEEAGELAEARDRESAVQEAADLLYFTLVAAARHGIGSYEINRELERRNRRVRRRPMVAKGPTSAKEKTRLLRNDRTEP